MTSKEKVLKVEPDAICVWFLNEDTGKTTCWIIVGLYQNKAISSEKTRESLAWAEALRNQINETKTKNQTKPIL